MKDALPKILFFFAISALIFGYGFVTGTMQIFPYQVIKEARLAFSALRDLDQLDDAKLANWEYWDEPGAVVTYRELSSSAGSEDILFLGNDLTYQRADGTSLLAWIADRQGNIKHAWKHPGEIWAPLENRDAFGDSWRSYPVGAYVYGNGDLLVSYQGINTFPIAMGMAKFDKDSNLLWKNDGLYHHWFSVGPNGDIYIPGTKIGESPMQIADRRKRIFCSDTQFPYDTMAILNANGELQKEIDLFEAFDESDLVHVFNSTAADPVTLQSCDPMHLNDAQVLTEAQSPEYPNFSAGDLLVSFRSLNGVGILDPADGKFKWFHTGTTQHQHSPRYFRDNKILVFDNYGGKVEEGTSRIVAIEVGTGRAETVFPREDTTVPDREIWSKVAGFIDIHPSNQRILVSFSNQGLLWEIDTNTGEVLWEFVNTHPIDGRPGRVNLLTARYADHLDFLMNGGKP